MHALSEDPNRFQEKLVPQARSEWKKTVCKEPKDHKSFSYNKRLLLFRN